MPAPWREMRSAARSDGSIALTTAASNYVPDCVQVSGTLPLEPDTASPIYLLTGAGCYEAFQLSQGGFSLFVPESALASGDLSVLFEVNGAWTAIPAVRD